MEQAFVYRRTLYLATVLVAALSVMIGRFFWLQVLRHEEFAREARRLTTFRRVNEPWRGQIKDRNLWPLAWTAPAMDLYGDLRVCSNHVAPLARTLGPLLGVDSRRLAHCLYTGLLARDGKMQQAVLLQRDVPLWQWQAVTQSLAQAGFDLNLRVLSRGDKALLQRLRTGAVMGRESQRREYPQTNLAAKVIGPLTPAFGDIGDEGMGGIELQCNTSLSGEAGAWVSTRSLRGGPAPFARPAEVPAVDGDSVVLTLDCRLQRIAEVALAEAVARTGARHGAVIIMEPASGEVLALASLPTFSLRAPWATPLESLQEYSVSARGEPGSVFKLLVLATALDLGVLTLDHRVDGEHGWYARVQLKDHASFGVLTVLEAFGHSSDICFAKIALAIGPERLYHSFTNFGLGAPMGIMLPGEVGGWVKPWTNWTEHLTARIGFGQSVAVTQLGMTVAYAAVVNEGRLMRPLLVRRLVSPEGRVVRQIEPVCVRQVLRPEATRETVKALTAATHAPFTGRLAGSDRYPPGGKTSTAQVPITKDSRLGRGAAPVGATAAYPTAQAQARGYRRDVVNVSFYGHAPADRPKVVISVTLDEVDRSQTGGHAAAPVFRAIIEQTLACLGVPPGVQPERRGGLQLAGGVGERRDTFPTSR